MSDFTPVELVHVRTGEEITAFSALSFNDLAGKGFKRKNKSKAPTVDASLVIGGDTVIGSETGDDTADSADSASETDQAKPQRSNRKR